MNDRIDTYVFRIAEIMRLKCRPEKNSFIIKDKDYKEILDLIAKTEEELEKEPEGHPAKKATQKHLKEVKEAIAKSKRIKD